MKRTLIAGAAFASLLAATSAYAADLPVYSKAPPPAVIFDWNGFYIGTNVGYSWGRGTTDGNVTGTAGATPLATLPLSGRADVNGFLGGAQFGYNWQNGSWLLGLEADIQGTNERGRGDVCTVADCSAGGTFAFTRDYSLNWFGTARGRAGFLAADRLLLYVTGGLAYGSFTGSSFALPLAIGTWSRVNAGWTVGAGAEAALGDNWSVKFEYLYMDLGSVGGSAATNVSIAGATTTTRNYVFNTRFTDSIARVGLNYRFGGGAVVAKY